MLLENTRTELLENGRTVPGLLEDRRTVAGLVKKMTKMRVAYNHAWEKRRKIKCPNCGGMVRRDGMAAHKRSAICARKRTKYNKKGNDLKKIPCSKCGKRVCKGKMARHQRGSRCKA